jgi:hypothetical protein
MAALVCLLGRKFLCWDDPNKVMAEGKFDHCGMHIYLCDPIVHFLRVSGEADAFVLLVCYCFPPNRHCRARLYQAQGR